MAIEQSDEIIDIVTDDGTTIKAKVISKVSSDQHKPYTGAGGIVSPLPIKEGEWIVHTRTGKILKVRKVYNTGTLQIHDHADIYTNYARRATEGEVELAQAYTPFELELRDKIATEIIGGTFAKTGGVRSFEECVRHAYNTAERAIRSRRHRHLTEQMIKNEADEARRRGG
jgi:hypothetical protein